VRFSLFNRNVDPRGKLPAADGDGRLVLEESKAVLAKTALSALVMGFVALYALLFWYKALVLRIVPPVTDIRGRVYGVVSLLAWPGLFWLLLKLLLSARLTVDTEGIVFRDWKGALRLGWEDVREVRLREVVMGRGGKVQTRTLVMGPQDRISWMPVFGVAPRALAAYLIERRREARPAVPLEGVDLGPVPVGRWSTAAGKAMAVTRLAHLVFVLVLGGFALVAGLVVSTALGGGSLAAAVLGRFLH